MTGLFTQKSVTGTRPRPNNSSMCLSKLAGDADFPSPVKIHEKNKENNDMKIKMFTLLGSVLVFAAAPAFAAPTNPQPASPGPGTSTLGPISPGPAGNNPNPAPIDGSAPTMNPDMNTLMPSSGTGTNPAGTLPCSSTGSLPSTVGTTGTNTTGETNMGAGTGTGTTGNMGSAGTSSFSPGTGPCE